MSRNAADRIERIGQARRPHLSEESHLPTASMSSVKPLCALPAVRAARSPRIGGIGSLRGLHNAQNAACASACALALGVSTDVLQNGLRNFPGHCASHGAGRPPRMCCSSTTPRAPTPMRRRMRPVVVFRYLLDRRRQAELGGIAGLSEYFPRIRRPI